MFLHDTFQSLFAKLTHTVITYRYRDVSLKDWPYEYDLPIYNALKPPMLQLSASNFLVNMPSLVLGKVIKFQRPISSRFGDIPEKPQEWMKTTPPATNRVMPLEPTQDWFLANI